MLGTSLSLSQYFQRASHECAKVDAASVELLASEIHSAYEDGRFVFLCGNGGSGATASHLCEDLAKCTIDRKDYSNSLRKRLKVLSLADNTSAILAWGNDEGFDCIFAEQLKNLASPDDLLIAFSGSGNSPNIIQAVDWANRARLRTWGVTGFDGGLLRDRAQESIHAPLFDMGMVESIHLLLFHWVLGDVYARIYRSGRHEAVKRTHNPRRKAA